MDDTVKKLPAMRETQVRSLGRKDPLQKGMATHSSILAWGIPWTEEPVTYSPWGRRELDMAEGLTLSLSAGPGLDIHPRERETHIHMEIWMFMFTAIHL